MGVTIIALQEKMEYFGRTKTTTYQTKIANSREEIELEIKALDWENYIVVEGKNGGYPILRWEKDNK